MAVLFLVFSLVSGSLLLLIQKKSPTLNKAIFSRPEKVVRKIRINFATKEQWESLPMIGDYRATMIVETRERRGGFSSIEEVRYVKGIGPYVFNQIKPYLEAE